MHILYNLKKPFTFLPFFFACLIGGLLTLSFAPFSFFSFAILSPALLLFLWLEVSPQRAFGLGWCFGVGLFSTGVYWIFISIHIFGNIPSWAATLLTSALVGFLALYPAINGYLLNYFFPKNNFTKIFLAFPALWILLEYLRSWLLTGFPWLLIGYSQINSPLKGYAPILGVYGVSLATLFCSSLLLLTWLYFKKKDYKKMFASLIGILSIASLGFILSIVSWTTASDHPIKVSLIQGNIPQALKWSPEQVQPTLNRYIELTRSHWDSNIIIWPESAVPLPLHYATDFLQNLASEAGKHHASLITGIPIKSTQEEGYYNGILTLGNGEGIYTKRHLVPFGEFIPFKKWLGHFMDILQVPMADFVPGPLLQTPLIANGLKIAAFICYEIAYPEHILLQKDNIDLMLAISNDAWFGRSIAQAQHAEMAQMRALEMGRPLLFVGNDGITAIINARGKIQAIAPQYTTFVLTENVQTMKGKTPWQYLSMYPMYLIVILLLGTALLKRQQPC